MRGPTFRVLRNAASILLGDFAGDLLIAYATALAALSLGPRGFGTFNEARAFMDPFEAASMFGLGTVALRFAASRGGCDGALRGTVLGLRAGAAIVAVLLAFGVAFSTGRGSLAPLLAVNGAEVLIAPLSMVAILPFQWHQTIHRRLAVPLLLGLVRLGGAFTAGRLSPSPVAFQLAVLLAAICAVPINLWWASRVYPARLRFDATLARALLTASWPMALFGMVVIVYSRAGYFLLRSCGAYQQGLYAAADSLVRPILAIATAVFMSLLPTVSELAVHEDAALLYRTYRRTMLVMAALTLPALGLAWILAGWILRRFAPAYAEAVAPFRVLSLGTVFIVFNIMSTLFLTALGRFRLMFACALVDLVLYLALASRLVPAHGALGAALATTIMEGANVVFQLVLLSRLVRDASARRAR